MIFFNFHYNRSICTILLLALTTAFCGNAMAQVQKPAKKSKEDLVTSTNNWPKKVQGPQNFKLRERKIKAKKGEQDKGFSYETTNYIVTSPVKLDENVKTAVGELCEGTLCAVKALPLPIPRADKRHSGDRLKVVLVKTREDYAKAGGPEGSSGVFRSQTRNGKANDYVLVPFESFGISPDGTLRQGGNAKTYTLSHELAHQITMNNFGRNIWAIEGFAEYVAYTPYEQKTYDFTGSFNKIRQVGMGYRNWNLPFSMNEFLKMPQNEFYAIDRRLNKQCYILSTLILAFFFHLDGDDGAKAFALYMKEIQRSGDIEKANKKLFGKYKTVEGFQTAFVDAWGKQGIKIKFKNAK